MKTFHHTKQPIIRQGISPLHFEVNRVSGPYLRLYTSYFKIS